MSTTDPKQSPDATRDAAKRTRGLTPPTRRPGPVGGKRDTNRKERSEALTRAGLKLFLERGVENVTVDEIAKEAGTAKGNFYRYASDKRDLVDAIIMPLATAFDDAFERCELQTGSARTTGELTSAYMRLAMDLFQATTRDPSVALLYLQEARAPAIGARAPITAFERRVTERAIALTEHAHKHGLLRKVPPAVSALAVIGAVERLLIAQLRDRVFDNPADVVRTLVQLVMEGIAG